MRGLLLLPGDEPAVVSKQNWNQPGAIADRMKCQKFTRIPLPMQLQDVPAVLFTDADELLLERPVNDALTALMPMRPQQFRGAALFIGTLAPGGPFCDLDMVSIFKIAMELVRAQRRMLVA